MPCFEDIIENNPGTGDDEDPTPPDSLLVIYDSVVTDNFNGTRSIKFEVGVSPINFDSPIQFSYSTRAGTAKAGTDYTSKSGTITVPAGESEVEIEIFVVGPVATGSNAKVFYLDINNPVGALIDEGTATGTITYDPQSGGGGGGGGGLPKKYMAISRSNMVIYNQFTACKTKNQCTSHAMAAAMTLMHYREKGAKKTFDAQQIFTASGGTPCSGSKCICTSWFETKVFTRAKNVGIRQGTSGSVFRKIKDTGTELAPGSSTSFASDGARRTKYIEKIKTNVKKYGVVYVSSSWYKLWDYNGGKGVTNSNPKMRIPTTKNANPAWKDARSSNHSYIILGWDDDKYGGSFRVQSSHGTAWGNSGWAWLPYAYIRASLNTSTKKFRRNTSEITNSSPWFRCYRIIYKG